MAKLLNLKKILFLLVFPLVTVGKVESGKCWDAFLTVCCFFCCKKKLEQVVSSQVSNDNFDGVISPSQRAVSPLSERHESVAASVSMNYAEFPPPRTPSGYGTDLSGWDELPNSQTSIGRLERSKSVMLGSSNSSQSFGTPKTLETPKKVSFSDAGFVFDCSFEIESGEFSFLKNPSLVGRLVSAINERNQEMFGYEVLDDFRIRLDLNHDLCGYKKTINVEGFCGSISQISEDYKIDELRIIYLDPGSGTVILGLKRPSD